MQKSPKCYYFTTHAITPCYLILTNIEPSEATSVNLMIKKHKIIQMFTVCVYICAFYYLCLFFLVWCWVFNMLSFVFFSIRHAFISKHFNLHICAINGCPCSKKDLMSKSCKRLRTWLYQDLTTVSIEKNIHHQ